MRRCSSGGETWASVRHRLSTRQSILEVDNVRSIIVASGLRIEPGLKQDCLGHSDYDTRPLRLAVFGRVFRL